MPVSVRRDPFEGRPEKPGNLLTPQVRVLAVLMPEPDTPPIDWPLCTRRILAKRVGWTPLSGTLTRALNGLKRDCKGGKAHSGLLALGYVEVVVLDIDGRLEVSYKITPAGIAAYREHERQQGSTPEMRSRETSINNRYKHETDS